jgi:hypothetical protein
MKSGTSLFPFKLPIKVLKLAGIWRTKSSSWGYFIYGIIMQLIFIEVFMVLQFIYLFTFETFEDFAFLMTLLPTFISFVVKVRILTYFIDDIEDLLVTIIEIVDQENFQPSLQKYLNQTDFIFKFFCSSAILTTTVGLGVPFRLQRKSNFVLVVCSLSGF